MQAIDPNFRTASISEWNVAVQKSIGLKDSFEVDYLGASGHHLPNLSDASSAAQRRASIATRLHDLIRGMACCSIQTALGTPPTRPSSRNTTIG